MPSLGLAQILNEYASIRRYEHIWNSQEQTAAQLCSVAREHLRKSLRIVTQAHLLYKRAYTTPRYTPQQPTQQLVWQSVHRFGALELIKLVKRKTNFTYRFPLDVNEKAKG